MGMQKFNRMQNAQSYLLRFAQSNHMGYKSRKAKATVRQNLTTDNKQKSSGLCQIANESDKNRKATNQAKLDEERK